MSIATINPNFEFRLQKENVSDECAKDDENLQKHKSQRGQSGEGDVLILRKKKKKAVKA